jgi:hypothetical protein
MRDERDPLAHRRRLGLPTSGRPAACRFVPRLTPTFPATKRGATAEAPLSRRLTKKRGSRYLSTSASAAPSRFVEVAASWAIERARALTHSGLTHHPDGVDEAA